MSRWWRGRDACLRGARAYTEHKISMGRTLSLLARLPRLEADGVTHRRECECVRCDAGFRPSEHERAEARRRFEAQRARERAGRAVARAEERLRMKQAVVDEYVDVQVKAADDQIRALRAARERGADDGRLAQLWELRRTGMSLEDALAEIDKQWAQQGSNLRPTD